MRVRDLVQPPGVDLCGEAGVVHMKWEGTKILAFLITLTCDPLKSRKNYILFAGLY